MSIVEMIFAWIGAFWTGAVLTMLALIGVSALADRRRRRADVLTADQLSGIWGEDDLIQDAYYRSLGYQSFLQGGHEVDVVGYERPGPDPDGGIEMTDAEWDAFMRGLSQ